MNMRLAEPWDLAVLRRWDSEPHVVANMGADDAEDWGTELGRRPDWREWWIAEADGHPIGIVQIIDPARDDTHYWGEIAPGYRTIDIWIGESEYVGRGFGTRMMRFALDRCFTDPSVTAVLIDPLAANVRGRRFYERLGFRFVERRTFGEDDCAVYRLDRLAA